MILRRSHATARYCHTLSREAPPLGPSSAPSPSPKPPTSRRPLTPTTSQRLSSSGRTSAADGRHHPSRSEHAMPQPHHPPPPCRCLAPFCASVPWRSSRAAAVVLSVPLRRHRSACHCPTWQRTSSTTLAHSRDHLTRRCLSRGEAMGREREEMGNWQQEATLRS